MDRREQPREGVFWDIQAGRVPTPPAAVTLGWEVVDVDPESGTLDLAFDAGERFLNPAGTVQGGFLAAMLDDTMGPALVATLPPGYFAPTLDLQVQFLRPARPGRILGHGEVVKRGREVCFLSGRLTDAEDRLLATGTATARIQPMETPAAAVPPTSEQRG
ncbi:phenylacetic acid degradation protein [Streptomonospora alba]|uniref:Phenylacetic acid degradation protein n=1 Tax=Streptomonospora alba TaxID=183763 RepID=A0A0C2G3L4_9ACTN|nr:PaaI family thioesterase [Streptomonospora alba]KIH97888.1 phenylacetic acid degradation protein [Streptomonospora alba]